MTWIAMMMMACSSDPEAPPVVMVDAERTVGGDVPDKSIDPEAPAAQAVLKKADGGIFGAVHFAGSPTMTKVSGQVRGLEPGSVHGLHVHEGTTCGDGDFSKAGGHFAPGNNAHGGPDAAKAHAGDLGNITAGPDGIATIEVQSNRLVFEGDNSFLGHAVILHAGADDLKSQPSGDAGGRMGCGVVTAASGKGATHSSPP